MLDLLNKAEIKRKGVKHLKEKYYHADAAYFKKKGFTATDLKDYFDVQELKTAGFTKAELITANISSIDLDLLFGST